MPRAAALADDGSRAIIRDDPDHHARPPTDIIFLLERLESQIATGTGLPATRKVLVDRDAILDLIDQLRVAIPEEVRAAKRINAEGERILEKAQDEATRIVSRAQEQAAFLIGERGLTETAQAEGRRIIEQADEVAEGIRRGADDYAAGILGTLEEEAVKALAGIRKGMDVLDDRRGELQAAAPGNGEGPELTDDEMRMADEDADSRSPLLR